MKAPFLDFLYSNGLWISLPLFAAGIVLLISSIRKAIHLRAENLILSCSLNEQQHVEFSETGPVVLCMEGPLFTRRFAKTEFELRANDGAHVKGRTTWLHARSSSFSRIRMEMKIYDIPMPGRYELRILNLGAPQPGDREHLIIFMKPCLVQSMIQVIGILLSSIMCIGSIILFLFRYVES